MELASIILSIAILLSLGLWTWALVDLSKSKFKSGKANLTWLLIILFFPITGSIIYFQLKKTYTERHPRQFQPKFN